MCGGALQAEIGFPSAPFPGAGPGAEGGLPTVLSVVMLPLAPHPCGSQPLGPGVWPCGSPEGGTVRPTGGGSSQRGGGRGGRNQSDRPRRSRRQGTDPRRAGRGRVGPQLLPPVSRPPHLARPAPTPRTPGLRPSPWARPPHHRATPPSTPLNPERAPRIHPFSRYGN